MFVVELRGGRQARRLRIYFMHSIGVEIIRTVGLRTGLFDEHYRPMMTKYPGYVIATYTHLSRTGGLARKFDPRRLV